MKSNLLSYRPNADLFGAFASGLCMIHCILTPFLFIAQSCSISCCEASPVWWKWLDYLFLVISFVAVYRSNQTTSKVWIGRALWISWYMLALVILNEKVDLMALPEYAIYFPALSLVGFHLYNQKYCQCGPQCEH